MTNAPNSCRIWKRFFVKRASLLFLFLLSISSIFLALYKDAAASPEFSGQTRLPCTACHIHPDGGGALTLKGDLFKSNGYILPSEEGAPLLKKRLLKSLLGLLHVLFGVAWFGSIIYVHLIIKPQSLVSGMPKSEKFLGRLCILVVGVTGIGLSLLKFQEVHEIWHTTFGLIWIVKVGTYLAMVIVAAVATTYIDRRLIEAAKRADAPAADGKEGRPAHILHGGRLYDVTGSKLWKNGVHMARHFAGTDLTEAMDKAPHGLEVLERTKDLGPAPPSEKEQVKGVLRLFVFLAYFVLGCVLIVLICIAWWRWGPPLVDPFPSWTKEKAESCTQCHHRQTPALLVDWAGSTHAKNRISCMHCHLASGADKDLSKSHQKYGPDYVSAVVSPIDCSPCHLDRFTEFQNSKHAGTVSIVLKKDPFLREGRLSEVEMVTGCEGCHGSGIAPGSRNIEYASGMPRGIGRVNPDASKGYCGACHGPHRFSVSTARRAEACGKCHVGPEHPQMEIFRESKHGTLYQAFGHDWDWKSAGSTWTAGVDYRTPTCAACHMSGTGKVPGSHDVGFRLSWELQESPTVRPDGADWMQSRIRMEAVCRQCHGPSWIQNHFDQLDRTVHDYNVFYDEPARRFMEGLYAKKILDSAYVTDERLEISWLEMGRREGRSAKMGAAMMAPDYTWWHGHYQLKKRFLALMNPR